MDRDKLKKRGKWGIVAGIGGMILGVMLLAAAETMKEDYRYYFSSDYQTGAEMFTLLAWVVIISGGLDLGFGFFNLVKAGEATTGTGTYPAAYGSPTYSNLMTCPDCGGMVSRSAKLCPHCGSDVAAQIQAQYEQEQRRRQEERQRVEMLQSVAGPERERLLMFVYKAESCRQIQEISELWKHFQFSSNGLTREIAQKIESAAYAERLYGVASSNTEQSCEDIRKLLEAVYNCTYSTPQSLTAGQAWMCEFCGYLNDNRTNVCQGCGCERINFEG